MRLIDALELKRSLTVSDLVEDGKHVFDIIDDQPTIEELTPEEASSEIAAGSMMCTTYWLDIMIRLKQMGYAICRRREE